MRERVGDLQLGLRPDPVPPVRRHAAELVISRVSRGRSRAHREALRGQFGMAVRVAEVEYLASERDAATGECAVPPTRVEAEIDAVVVVPRRPESARLRDF